MLLRSEREGVARHLRFHLVGVASLIFGIGKHFNLLRRWDHDLCDWNAFILLLFDGMLFTLNSRWIRIGLEIVKPLRFRTD